MKKKRPKYNIYNNYSTKTKRFLKLVKYENSYIRK